MSTKVEHAMVAEVARKLADHPAVITTAEATNDKGPFVRCLVESESHRRRVKRSLHEYPVYVELVVDG